MAFKIFLDLDGVITNFDRALSKVTGLPEKKGFNFGNDPKIWGAINKAGEGFWSSMEWMPDGRQLWNAIEIYKPTVLTAPSRHESSVEGKKIWLKNNLPGVPYIIDDKKDSYADKDFILIDDREKNIKKWEQAGGIGILHKSTNTTLDKLKEIMGSIKEAKWVESPGRDKRVYIPTLRGGRGEKAITPKKGPYDRKKFNIKDVEAASSITDRLDRIADTLEFKGLIKEAAEIDVISNTIEATEIPQDKDRPAPVFPRESPKVKDDKDHFPIPDAAHGRNALARVNQYGEVPGWYDGSLEDLKAAVVKAVKSKFPSIDVEEEKYESE